MKRVAIAAVLPLILSIAPAFAEGSQLQQQVALRLVHLGYTPAAAQTATGGAETDTVRQIALVLNQDDLDLAEKAVMINRVLERN